MKLNVKSLQRALDSVGFVYNGVKTTIEDALNVRIYADENGQIFLYAAGINGAGAVILSGTTKKPGEEIIIAYKDLVTAASNAFTEEITITQVEKEDKSYIGFKIGKAAAKCSGGGGVLNWDYNTDKDCHELFVVTNKEVQPKLQFASRFCNTSDELRPAMAGVNIMIEEDKVYATGTDGHRLCIFTLKEFHSAPKEYWGTAFIMDSKMAASMQFMDTDDVTFIMRGDTVIVKDATTTLFFRPPQGALKYTTIKGLLNAAQPENFDLFVITGVELAKAISRGVAFLERGGMYKYMAFLNGHIQFIQEDTGKAWDEQFENLSIEHEYRFNPETMIVLSSMKGDMSVKFNKDDKTRALLIENHESEISMLFMPLVAEAAK